MKRIGRLGKRTSWVLAMILIVVSISVAGPAGAAEKTVLTVWDWTSTEIPETMETLYAQFEQKHNCKVEVLGMDWQSLIGKYRVAAQGGYLPDVMELMAHFFVADWAEHGYLEILDPYVEKAGGEDFLNQYESWLLWPYKGHTYGLPIFGSDYGLFYNKTLLNEAGFAGPPTTWDELVSTAQKLTNPAKGEWGLAVCGNDAESLAQTTCFIAQSDGRVGRVDGEIQINSPESLEGVQFEIDLANKYKVVPSFATSDFSKHRELFRSGRVAMHYDGAWYIPLVIEKNPEFEWDTALPPKGKVHGNLLYSGDNIYAMSSNCKNKELAWELIKHMTSEASNHFFTLAFYAFPAVTAVGQMEDIRSLPYLKPFLDGVRLGNNVNVWRELPQPVLKASEYFNVEMQSAALGKKTVKQAMDDVASKWQEMFSAWEDKYGALE